jgi:hypothetical protein
VLALSPAITRAAILALLLVAALVAQETVGRAPKAATAEQVRNAEAALADAEREHGPDARATGTAAQALARLRFGGGDLKDAERLSARAAGIFEKSTRMARKSWPTPCSSSAPAAPTTAATPRPCRATNVASPCATA